MREGRQAYILSTLETLATPAKKKETLATVHSVSLRCVWIRGEIFFPYHFDVLILIRSIKYRLIKKLIAQMETNWRDEIY